MVPSATPARWAISETRALKKPCSAITSTAASRMRWYLSPRFSWLGGVGARFSDFSLMTSSLIGSLGMVRKAELHTLTVTALLAQSLISIFGLYFYQQLYIYL